MRNLTILLLCLSFFSCEEPAPLNTQRLYLEVKDVTIEATEYDVWHYFSFTTGEEVGTGAANAATDKEWQARQDWDIAFTTLHIRTNGGYSGIKGESFGGVFEISELTGTDKTLAFNSLALAPSANKKAYEADKASIITIGVNPTKTYIGGSNALASTWISFNALIGDAGEHTSARKIFVFRTVDGKYAKVLLKSFIEGKNGLETREYIKDPETGKDTDRIKPAEGRRGVITFSYAYQPNGSESVMTKK